MNFETALPHTLFTEDTVEVLHANKWSIVTEKYLPGIDSLTINSDKGYVEVLPFIGQITWGTSFNGKSLRVTNIFPEPKPATLIEDTYGCFIFHSGLLTAGCPSPEGTHPLHDEFSYAPVNSARLIVTDSAVKAESSRKYLRGFGDNYLAKLGVTLQEDSSTFDIHLQVTNLSKYAPMPLQYICHMNYAFVPGGIMSQNLPDDAFQLRRSIPAYVKPTPQWIQLNEDIIAGKKDADSLVGAEEYDPGTVFFADRVSEHTDYAVLNLKAPDGTVSRTEFDTVDLPVVTHQILYNANQKVATSALPGTLRPEGRLAAQKAGTLIQLAAGGTRKFNVHTGVRED